MKMAEKRAARSNCYECRHRRSILGDTHSSCSHPTVASIAQTDAGQLLQMLGKRAGGPAIATTHADALGVKGSAHGIAHGWFQWPFNFDPIWLESCDGFEAIEERVKT